LEANPDGDVPGTITVIFITPSNFHVTGIETEINSTVGVVKPSVVHGCIQSRHSSFSPPAQD
jgi:hypothetical protein